MNIKITKIKGGKLPDGFYVIGKGDVPMETFNVMVNPVLKSNSDKFQGVSNWFISESIKKCFTTEYGYIFMAGGSLWKWEEMILDGNKWIRD